MPRHCGPVAGQRAGHGLDPPRRDRVVSADAETLRTLRGRDVGFVFQDPTTTLNPVLPVGRQIVEGQVALGRVAAGSARSRAVQALREVEIAAPETRVEQYPHQFSGGMRQRAVIAMAMSGQPKLIIADEPTTALDVTVQAQVLALLARRQAATGAAAILVTHDLGVVAEVARRVAVMYGGRIVETASVRDIFERPRHPYTAALLKSAPRLEARGGRLDPIPGQPPTPSALPAGCSFHPRCGLAAGRSRCASEDPASRTIESGHGVACHFAEEQAVPSPVFAAARAEAPRAAVERTPLLAIENLQVHFPIRSKVLRRTIGAVRAVDGVSLTLSAGETLGLVGESGCGKTTVSRAVMGLVPVTGGRIAFDGQTISGLSRERLRPYRRQMQYVFQGARSLRSTLCAASATWSASRSHSRPLRRDGRRCLDPAPVRDGRPLAVSRGTSAARVLGLAEATHRHRAGAGIK